MKKIFCCFVLFLKKNTKIHNSQQIKLHLNTEIKGATALILKGNDSQEAMI